MTEKYTGFRACFTDLTEVEAWSEKLLELVETKLGERIHCVWMRPERLMYHLDESPKDSHGIVEQFDEGADAPPYPYMVKIYARQA